MGVIRVFKGNKVYFRPQGFLDAKVVSEIIMPADIKLIERKGVKCVVVDFSKIISANMNAIKFLNDVFEMLYKKNIDCTIFNANNNVLNILNNLDSSFFNYYESEEIMKLFCDEDYAPNKPIFLCCIKDDQNKNMLIFNLVKKGFTPIVVDSMDDIGSEDAIIIKKSFISRIANRVSAIMKNGIIYFYFNDFLDANISNMFDLEYYRRNLLIGFKVFIFDMNGVKGMNVHAVRFLSKLGVEAAEYGALLAIIGLSKKYIQPKLIQDLEAVGFVFFKDEEEFLNSDDYKDAINNSSVIYKKSRKITKDFVKVLPFFVNATISTIEMMTGVKATKESPNIKEVNIDTSRKDLVASSQDSTIGIRSLTGFGTAVGRPSPISALPPMATS